MSAVLLCRDGMLTAWRICSELCDDVRWWVQITVDLVLRTKQKNNNNKKLNYSNKFSVTLQLLE